MVSPRHAPGAYIHIRHGHFCVCFDGIEFPTFKLSKPSVSVAFLLCRRNVNLTVKMSHYDRKGTKNSEINKKIGRKIAIPTGFYGFSLYF